MDGLHEVAAAAGEIELDGETYRLAPLRAKHFAQIERRMLDARPDPIEAIKPRLDGLSPEMQKHLLGLAYERILRGPCVTADELWHWMNSPEGVCYTLWLSLRENHARITLARCEELVLAMNQEALARIQRRLDEASGFAVENSSGQTQPTAPEIARAAPSPGGGSFAS